MTLTPDVWAMLIQWAIKFGIDSAIAIANGIKGGKTIDDAINALETAKTKTAQDYLNEAKGNLPPVVQVPPGSPVPPGSLP